MRLSQFLVLSDETFLDAAGDPVRLVAQTRTTRVYALHTAVLDTARRAPADLPADQRDELAEAGILVDPDRDEFGEAVAENRAELAAITGRTFVLMPAAYCNMGCGYCGQQHVRLPKREQHRDAVKQRLLLAVADPATTGLQVSWFGAEPMMGYDQILDLSAAVIPACADRGIPYTSKMVTNGSLLTLDRIRTLHRQAGVGWIEITLDGPAGRHDLQRPLKSGRGSFDRIVATIRAACAEDLPGHRFTIRTNVSRANQDEHREFAAAMRAGGLADQPKVEFYTALVREWGNDVSAYAVDPDDVIRIERNWLDAYTEHGLRTTLLPLGRKRMVCVAVTRNAEVIAPGGQVHSCTEQPLVPGREHTDLAHVTDLQTPALRPAGEYDDWNESLLGDTEAYCPTCAIFPICGGSCPLVWRAGSPACPSTRKTLPMRLSRYATALGLRPAGAVEPPARAPAS